MKKIWIPLLAISVLMTSCESQKSNSENSTEQKESKKVAYNEVKLHFLKNTVNPENLTTVKITSQEEFDSLFGVAAVMGSEKPTKVDFTKSFVLAVYEPSTDLKTTIKPVSLVENSSELVYTYSIKKGEKQSFTTTPSYVIVVDNQFDNLPVTFVQK